MAVGDVYKLTIIGLFGSDEDMNTFHYVQSAEGGITSPEAALVAAWDTNFIVAYCDCLATQYGILRYSCYRVWDTVGPLIYVNSTRAGVVTGGVYPQNLSVVISKRTAKPRQAGRGRFFMPAVPLSFIQSSGTDLSDTGLSAYTDLVASMALPITASSSTFIPVVFNKRNPLSASFFNAITRFVIDHTPRQQRRREDGVRIHPKKHRTPAVAAASLSESEQMTAFAQRWRQPGNKDDLLAQVAKDVQMYANPLTLPAPEKGATEKVRAGIASKGGQE